jgi:hypothetical protein
VSQRVRIFQPGGGASIVEGDLLQLTNTVGEFGAHGGELFAVPAAIVQTVTGETVVVPLTQCVNGRPRHARLQMLSE